jgi:Rrf2 family protein
VLTGVYRDVIIPTKVPGIIAVKFSTRARYGLRAMIALAQSYPGGPISLAEISRSEEISLSYLEQLMAILRKASLVEGIRGAHGGYQLSADPASITAGQVVRALEGSLAPAECVSEGVEAGYCRRETVCPSKPLWEQVRNSIAQVLDTTTLADLCAADGLEVSQVSLGRSKVEA